MGALSGSITASAYYVAGDVPKDFRDRYVESLGRHRFRDIEIETDQDESTGWVVTEDPFDTHFDVNKILWGDYLIFSLRQDILRIPPALFKLHFRRELKEYCKNAGKERLTKAEEEEIRDRLERQLRRRLLPATRLHDTVWNIARHELWLFSANKRVNEVFLELFGDTFDQPLIPRNPYSRLERHGLTDESLDQVAHLEPSSFAAPPESNR